MFERGRMDIEDIAKGRRCYSRYPWSELGVGEFFVVPPEGLGNARSAMSRHNQRNAPAMFAMRTIDGQHRMIRLR